MKTYCTQNNGDCTTCSLTNYGRDCKNNEGADWALSINQQIVQVLPWREYSSRQAEAARAAMERATGEIVYLSKLADWINN